MSVTTPQQLRIGPYANGFGTWCARVTFGQPLADLEFVQQLPTIEAAARGAIVEELTAREQKTGEDYAEARRRIETSVERLVLVDKKTDAEGRILVVIFVE